MEDVVKTEAPAAPVIPDQLNELDKLKLQLAVERSQRARAEFVLAQEAVQRANQARQTVEQDLAGRYRITPQDQVDPNTGNIVRAEKK